MDTKALERRIKTSTLFLFAVGAMFALYGFFTDLTNSEKIAHAEEKQDGTDNLSANSSSLVNENSHLFVSCGGFLE